MEIIKFQNNIEKLKENESLYLKHIEHNESFLYLKPFENRHGVQFAIVESIDGDVYHFKISNLEIDKIISKDIEKSKQIEEESYFERSFN